MKFESKFGIGEIVLIGSNLQKRTDHGKDFLGEVVAVTFETRPNEPHYIVDVQVPTGIQRMHMTESQLVGDPEFDQEAGRYPEEE